MRLLLVALVLPSRVLACGLLRTVFCVACVCSVAREPIVNKKHTKQIRRSAAPARRARRLRRGVIVLVRTVAR